MTLRARVLWNVSVYVLGVLIYFAFSDGDGRYETSMILFIYLGPLIILIDAIIASRKDKK